MVNKNDMQVSQERRLNFLEEYFFNLDADPDSLEDFLKKLEFEGKAIWDKMQQD